jgi:hydrogenase maturation protein HypF
MLLGANYRSVDQGYTFFIDEKRKVVPLKPLISGLIHDIKIGKDPAYISGKFHRTIINITLETVRKIAEMTGLKKVVLSGGCFQNRVLLDEISDGIKKEGLEPFTNTVTAPNDSAISYGQVLVASKKQKLLCV